MLDFGEQDKDEECNPGAHDEVYTKPEYPRDWR